MGEFVGYDPEGVRNLATSVNRCAFETASTIVSNLRTEFVVPMSAAWFTPNGVTYFSEFAEAVKNCSKDITNAFNDYIDILSDVEKNWAENVGEESIGCSISKVSALTLNLDVSSVKDKEGTRIGVYEAEAQAVVSKLPALREKIESDIKEIATKLENDSAFIGKGQEEAVKNCFEVVEGVIAKLFDSLENDVPKQLKEAIEKHGTFASSVSNSLNNTQVV